MAYSMLHLVLLLFVALMLPKAIPAVRDSGRYLSNRAASGGATDLQRLVTFLKSQNPDKVRPVRDHTTTVPVILALGPRRITLDDAKEEMALDAWSVMSWHDEYLTWDASDYGGLEKVELSSSDVWLPDLTVRNRVEGTDTPLSEVTVQVSSTGLMILFRENHVKVPCAMDLQNWPSDRHNCSINFESRAHDVSEMIVVKSSEQEELILGGYTPSDDWLLVNHSSVNRMWKITGALQIDLRFSFLMQRVAADKACYIINSSYVVILCLLAAYFLPATKIVARLQLHILTISALIAGNLVLYLSLPTNGGALPHVVRYYSCSLIVATVSLLFMICMYDMARPGPTVWDSVSRIVCNRKMMSIFSHRSFTGPETTTTGNDTHIGMETSSNSPPGQPDENKDMLIDVTSLTPTTAATKPALDTGLRLEQNRMQRQKMAMVRVVNLVAGIAFAIAFLVDYIALRSYTTE